MANNIKGGAPNAVVAKTTVSFATAGLTALNTEIVYLVDDPLKSWVPGRAINGISGFEANKGYYMVAKTDMDLSTTLVPPISGAIQLAVPGSFTATPASGTQINLSWSAVANATGYVVDRATNSGFTSGVNLAIYSGSGTSFNDTGLSSSTTFYYRIRATAAGYIDSGYSTANATTTGTLIDLTFTSRSGTITESPAHTFSGNGDTYMRADQILLGDGWVQSDIQGAGAEAYGMGLDHNSANTNYGGSPNWDYYGFVYTGKYWAAGQGEGTEIDTTVTWTAGDKMRLRRTSGTVYFEKTSDGINWTILHTFTTSNSGTLYCKIGFSAANGGAVLVNPKGQNFS